MKRVVVAKNILPPYRVGFLRELGKRCDLTLALDAKSEDGREWKMETEFPEMVVKILDSKALKFQYKGAEGGLTEKRTRQLSWGLWKVLGEVRPECVVSGELGLRTFLSAIWCKINGVPLVIWWEGTKHTEQAVKGVRLWLRKRLVQSAARFWSNGLASRYYLEGMGIASELIDDGMTGVDTSFFVERMPALREQKELLWERFHVETKPVLLFSGALSKRKGLLQLMDALAILEEQAGSSFTCLLAGDGELREEIEKRAANWKTVKVVLTGFLQKEALSECYSLADLYVLPTLEDNWALATVESLLCGIRSLISEKNGAVEDLAVSGTEEWIFRFDPDDAECFAQVLAKELSQSTKRVPEEKVRELADYYSASSQAERAFNCVQLACEDLV